jgi:hypothetical protein
MSPAIKKEGVGKKRELTRFLIQKTIGHRRNSAHQEWQERCVKLNKNTLSHT